MIPFLSGTIAGIVLGGLAVWFCMWLEGDFRPDRSEDS